MGITVDPVHILGSAEATANWLAEQSPNGAKVIMMGEASLRGAAGEEDLNWWTTLSRGPDRVASITLNYDANA